MSRSSKIINETNRYAASNYNPLPVVIKKALGVWVTDVEGKKYLDFLSAYSALNFGHNHPRLVAAIQERLNNNMAAVTSRAFHSDNLGEFCRVLAKFCGMNKVLPMNTGAEAVETAIKIARKWGYEVKSVESDKANIIVCANNFHGRTMTIVGFSTEEQYRRGFGPFTPGFRVVPFGGVSAFCEAIDKNTVAFLFEPIQGEGGVNIPPKMYLEHVREVCNRNNILMIADEIQTGFGRTGYDLACQGYGVKPDIILLGKALGGGLLPVSAVVSRKDVMDVIKPGDHGSTFGGNPLACAVGIEAICLLQKKRLSQRSLAMGQYLMGRLSAIKSSVVREVRGRGLMIGVEVSSPETARIICEKLVKKGVLCNSAHNVVRISPPLIISRKDAEWGLKKIEAVLKRFSV